MKIKNFLIALTCLCAILAFLVGICGFNAVRPAWHFFQDIKPGDFFTAATGLIIADTFFLTAYIYNKDKSNKSSEFYLIQIKEYFSLVVSLIDASDNTNVRWHQGVENLNSAINLSKKITESAHKTIYLTDAMNVAYQLVNILGGIDDFRFFYGLPLYQDKSGNVLFEESDNFHKGLYARISPVGLLMIEFFIIKVSECKLLLSEDKDYISVFDAYYMTTPFNSFFNSKLPIVDAVEQCLEKLQTYQNMRSENRGFGFHQPSDWENIIRDYIISVIPQEKSKIT